LGREDHDNVKGFTKKVLIGLAVVAALFAVLVLPELLRDKTPEKMPGDEGTYRVVTLYDSTFSDGRRIVEEMKDLATSYEGVPSFVYVDTSEEDAETGNLRLMAGRSYTVYFLGKNSEIITLWYELNFDKDTFIGAIEQCFGVKPKD
jgi:hypothetical protein